MSSSDYLVGIASYKRPNGCRTLDYLEKIGFPRERIVLSVQTQEDELSYTESGVADRVGKFIFRPASSAGGNRNNILDNVPQHSKIVLMDDDINGLQCLDKTKKRGLANVMTLCHFENIVKTGFGLACRNKTICFGISAVQGNSFFMQNGYKVRQIVTTQLMGLFVTKMRFDERFLTKEDYEFCCRVIRRYGACVRLNEIAVNAPKSPGGCREVWGDRQQAFFTADLLCETYPDILRPNPRRRGEVLMVGRPIVSMKQQNSDMCNVVKA